MKWLALALTLLMGVWFAFLSWREAQKPPPGGDLPPCHFIAVFLGLFIWTTWAWVRKPRRPRGHCRSCGYDLTGNVSGVCPECGSATAEHV
jgi:hypothetical protein